MLTRTWPYGTTKAVAVDSVDDAGRYQVVVCIDLANPAEAHVLINTAEPYRCLAGDRGTITFLQGGPYGGYWAYSAEGGEL